jgi:hypothetical protein
VLGAADSTYPKGKRVVWRKPHSLIQIQKNLVLATSALDVIATERGRSGFGGVGEAVVPMVYLWNCEQLLKVGSAVQSCVKSVLSLRVFFSVCSCAYACAQRPGSPRA